MLTDEYVAEPIEARSGFRVGTQRVFRLSDVDRAALPRECRPSVGEHATLILSVPKIHVALAQSERPATEPLRHAVHEAKRDLDKLIKASGGRDQGIILIPYYATITRSRRGAEDMALRRLTYEPEPPRGNLTMLDSAIAFVAELQEQRAMRQRAMNGFGQKLRDSLTPRSTGEAGGKPAKARGYGPAF